MLVLASTSPRRQELLRGAGIRFVVEPTDVQEVPEAGELPEVCAERLACEKARAASRKHPGKFVLGADTIVVVDDQILGKPKDTADAAHMLRLLSRRSHQVTTGVCLIGPPAEQMGRDSREPSPSFEDVRSETTLVTFGALTEGDIAAYVATGEPMDKAGAYAIQGIASRWITHVAGDYSNVVGLPVALVCRMLREHGAQEVA
jgi:nucleoside triphosphate pyrophosphatase